MCHLRRFVYARKQSFEKRINRLSFFISPSWFLNYKRVSFQLFVLIQFLWNVDIQRAIFSFVFPLLFSFCEDKKKRGKCPTGYHLRLRFSFLNISMKRRISATDLDDQLSRWKLKWHLSVIENKFKQLIESSCDPSDHLLSRSKGDIFSMFNLIW